MYVYIPYLYTVDKCSETSVLEGGFRMSTLNGRLYDSAYALQLPIKDCYVHSERITQHLVTYLQVLHIL